MTIDLVAQGPVYRGHKLARIVDEFGGGYDRGLARLASRSPIMTPVSTKAWARLDIRVIGNPWGISVSELPEDF